jgi:hypothetical protein
MFDVASRLTMMRSALHCLPIVVCFQLDRASTTEREATTIDKNKTGKWFEEVTAKAAR